MFKSKPTASNGRCFAVCVKRAMDPGVAVGPVTAVDQSLAARSERGAYLGGPGWNFMGCWYGGTPRQTWLRWKTMKTHVKLDEKKASQWENR